jgi:hypothetical protein
MRRLILAALVALLALTGCGAVRRDYACGTDVLPPVAVDPIVCHNGYPGVRWYSAPVGSFQQAGLPMDDVWWYGGSGTIGYGRGYDPRPASYWQNDRRYAPAAPPTVYVNVQPTNATVVHNQPVKPTKAAMPPAKPAATKAASPPPTKAKK